MNISMKSAVALNNAMLSNFTWSDDRGTWLSEVSIPLSERLEVTHSIEKTKSELSTIGVDMIDMRVAHNGVLVIEAWDVASPFQAHS